MSLDLESRLRIFLASAPQTMHAIQTLRISHSSITTWNLWREPRAGTVSGVLMTPANIDIKLAGNPGNLDQKVDIQLGLVDSMDLFREQLDSIPINTLEKIAITYREYMSDDLNSIQAEAILQVESVTWKKGAASISAVSPRLNITRTGENYTLSQIPMLRGFL